jgi:hypothetical protein
MEERWKESRGEEEVTSDKKWRGRGGVMQR